MSQVNRFKPSNPLLQRVQRYGALATLFRSAEIAVAYPNIDPASGTAESAMGLAFIQEAPIVGSWGTIERDDTMASPLVEEANLWSPLSTVVPIDTTSWKGDTSPNVLSDDQILNQISQWHQAGQPKLPPNSGLAQQPASRSKQTTQPTAEHSSTKEVADVRGVRSDDTLLHQIAAWHRASDLQGEADFPSSPIQPTEPRLSQEKNLPSDVNPVVPQPTSSPVDEEGFALPATGQQVSLPSSLPNTRHELPLHGQGTAVIAPNMSRSNDKTPPPNLQKHPVHNAATVSEPVVTDTNQAEKIPNTPLQHTGWPVERLNRPVDKPEITPPSLIAPVEDGKSTSSFVVRERVKNEFVEAAVAQVKPGQPTSAAIEFIPPRRLVAKSASENASQTLTPDIKNEPETVQMATPPNQILPMVNTPVGDLPADLWGLIGQEPPQTTVPSEPVLIPSQRVEGVSYSVSTNQQTNIERDLSTKVSNRGDLPHPSHLVMPIPDEEKQAQIMRMAVDEPLPQQPQSAIDEVPLNDDLDLAEQITQHFDTDAIAHLVLEEILHRYAAELEQLRR